VSPQGFGGGQTFEATTLGRGNPASHRGPLPGDALERKFRDFCASTLANEQIDEAMRLITDLDRADGVGALVAALTG
jgi:hypothetical protein